MSNTRPQERGLARVALIYPRMRYASGDPPIGLCSIAAVLRDSGVQVLVIDTTFNRNLDEHIQAVRGFRPQLIGIYVDTLMFEDSLLFIRNLKSLKVPILMGGPHATVMPEVSIRYADILVIGEGEETILDIIGNPQNLKDIKGIWYKQGQKIMKNQKREFIQDLNKLPFPAFEYLDMAKYISSWHYMDSYDVNLKGTNILTSRGCPFNCTYCQPTLDIMFGKKIRRRSVSNVVDEMASLMNAYKIKSFFFHDDTFTFDKGWVADFCSEIRRRRLSVLWSCNTRVDTIDSKMMRMMYAAGLRNLHVGVESGSDRIVNQIYKKNISLKRVRDVINEASEMGISCLCFFMIGAPTETKDEINKTLRFAASLKCDEVTFSITSPFPKTYLYDMVKDRGYKITHDYSQFNYYNGRSFNDDNMSFKQLKYYQTKGLLMFYLHPYRWHYILKHITSIKGWKKMITKIKRFIK